VSRPPRASIIVVEWRTAAYLPRCLEALEASELPRSDFEIIVVDNDSPTPIGHLHDAFPQVHFVAARRNLGFAGGCQLGLSRARGDVVLMVNPDCVVAPSWLAQMLAAFDDHPRAGVVGCKLVHPGTRVLQHAGGQLFANGRSEHRGRDEADHGQYDEPAEVDYVCGAALGVRRRTIDEVGFLSGAYFPAYYEETELCVRARRAGWRVLYTPHARAEHHESVASGGALGEVYLHRYHHGRMRFVYRNTAPLRLLTEFLPAEAAWLAHMDKRERWICARAYGKALLDAWREERGTAQPGDVSAERPPAAPAPLTGRAREIPIAAPRRASSRPPAAHSSGAQQPALESEG